jgi:tetratricopeptide (TPR) repeat protein
VDGSLAVLRHSGTSASTAAGNHAVSAERDRHRRLRHAIRAGHVVPFVGAGVSMAVRHRGTGHSLFPSWKEVLRRGVLRLYEEGEEEEADAASAAIEAGRLTEAAEHLRDGLTSAAWHDFIVEQFDRRVELADRDSLATARAIWELGSSFVITTNFDDVLAWAHPHADPAHWELENRAEFAAHLRGEQRGPVVWHLHGRYDHLANIIFTLKSYRELYEASRRRHGPGERAAADVEPDNRHEAALSFLRAMLVTRSLLFVGFSLTDQDFVNELETVSRALGGYGGDHFALLGRDPDGEDDSAMRKRLRAVGVQPIYYDVHAGDHRELLPRLRELTEYARPPGRPPSAGRGIWHNAFIGRRDEIELLADRLTTGAERIVEIVGPSGCGKTRLSRKLGEEVLQAFDGRVRFADLTEATTTKGLSLAIGRGLGVALTGPESPMQTVANLLPHHGRMLLVLDHFEQLLAAGADGRGDAVGQLRDWSARAPDVCFLVTTTRALGLGERPYELQPLGCPALERIPALSGADLEGCDAVALFCARRSEVLPGYRPGAGLEQVAAICARLGGLPLAIELAARAPMDVVDLERTLAANAVGAAPPPDELFTPELEAAMRLSWADLEPPERQALVELSACRGGFFEQDAAAMLAGTGRADAAATVRRLERHGLLYVEPNAYGRRLAVSPPVRLWLHTRVVDPDQATWYGAALQRHQDHYLRYGPHWAAAIDGPQAEEALDRLELEDEDLVAIYARCVSGGDPVAAGLAIQVLAHVAHVRGPAEVVPEYALDVLASLGEDEPELRSRLLVALAENARQGGRLPQAQAWAEEAVTVADGCSSQQARADARLVLALLRLGRGADAERACELLGEARELYGSGDAAACARVEAVLGRIASNGGNSERAAAHLAEAVRLHPESRGTPRDCELRRWRADVLAETEGLDAALAELHAAERLALTLDFPTELWNIRLAQANITSRKGDVDGAMGRYQELQRQAMLCGNRYGEALALGNLADSYRRAGTLAEERLRRTIELFREIGADDNLATARAQLAAVLLGQGRDDEALEETRDVARHFEGAGLAETYNGWLVAAMRARAEYRCGEPDVARRLAGELLRRTRYADEPDDEVRENWAELEKIAG